MAPPVPIDPHEPSAAIPLPGKPTKPPGERRFLAIFWVVCAVGTLAIILNFFFSGWYPTLAGCVAMMVSLGVIHRGSRKIIARRFLRPHAGFICPRCHYPLRKLPDVGICPECGTVFTRAAIAALWEGTYGFGQRYPRTRESNSNPALAVGLFLPPPPQAGAPWRQASLRNALERVEARARANGYSPPRFPANLLTLEEAISRLGRPIPSDLHIFLAWFDPALWSCFLNGASRGGSAMPFGGSASDGAFEDQIVIRTPGALGLVARDTLPAGSVSPAVPGGFDPLPIEFADSSSGHAITYVLGRDDIVDGAIVARSSDGETLRLADSLAQWLVRLAICNGIDAALNPELLAGLSPDCREDFLKDFCRQNPGSLLFGSENTARATSEPQILP